MRISRIRFAVRLPTLVLAAALAIVGATPGAGAENKLLAETVEFTGALLFLDMHVPGLVIGVVRNGETAVVGFGEIADKSGQKPDGDTLLRIVVTIASVGVVGATMSWVKLLGVIFCCAGIALLVI